MNKGGNPNRTQLDEKVKENESKSHVYLFINGVFQHTQQVAVCFRQNNAVGLSFKLFHFAGIFIGKQQYKHFIVTPVKGYSVFLEQDFKFGGVSHEKVGFPV
jgi:hypothetical protein